MEQGWGPPTRTPCEGGELSSKTKEKNSEILHALGAEAGAGGGNDNPRLLHSLVMRRKLILSAAKPQSCMNKGDTPEATQHTGISPAGGK